MSKIKPLWVVIWPSGEFFSRNIGVPAVFFTKKDALRFKRNSSYEILRIVKFEVKDDA
jgi:hypothetical protein